MNTQSISLLDDELVDMKFITQFTKLTDKWFYANSLKTVSFLNPLN